MTPKVRSDTPIYISDWAVANPLGDIKETVADRLFSGDRSGLETRFELRDGREVPVGKLPFEPSHLPTHLSNWDGRNNRLVYHCLRPLLPGLADMADAFGPERIGIVVGTSTTGIADTEHAIQERDETGQWPASYRYERQELGDPAAFLSAVLETEGPAYAVSTACTSGAKALISGARLLRENLCDAVICGGIDTLCELTINGFAALDSISAKRCNPFSRHRDGINIGEGGALFLLSRRPAALRLAGWGESADAHHLSAPDPEGRGAELAIVKALASAGIAATDIAYVNLHGTATILNDSMESRIAHKIFGPETPCSSTKSMTGHMLGAAGSNEAAFVAMALAQQRIPPHLWDSAVDEMLPVIGLVDRIGEVANGRYMMSCSYAFGGNNTALILAGE